MQVLEGKEFLNAPDGVETMVLKKWKAPTWRLSCREWWIGLWLGLCVLASRGYDYGCLGYSFIYAYANSTHRLRRGRHQRAGDCAVQADPAEAVQQVVASWFIGFLCVLLFLIVLYHAVGEGKGFNKFIETNNNQQPAAIRTGEREE